MGNSNCLCARCLGRRFSHVSLPDLLILIRPGVILLHLSRCLCVLCGSHLFLSHSYTLHTLTNLPSKFGDYSYDTLTFIPVFFKRWLIFSHRQIAGPRWRPRILRWDPKKFLMKGGKASFFQTNCWDLWAVENPGDEFFCGFFPPIFPQPSWNGEKSSSVFFHLCLSQIGLSRCPWVNLLHLSRCLCFLVLFIHSLRFDKIT